jgi:nucleoside-diphosphate-sugar epimerase
VKILVTGINGFVGSYLYKELSNAGHIVIGLDIREGRHVDHVCDLGDYPALEQVLLSEKPDAVAHLAAIANVDFQNPDKMYQINILGTINLLKAVSKVDIHPRFLFISSSQVYGEVETENLPITESTPIAPVNHYGASKAACESAVRAFALSGGFSYVIVRPFNHTGVGQAPAFVIPKIVEHFRSKAEVIELGNTWPLRDFLDVRDVVRAYRLMLEGSDSGKAYNIARGKSYSVDQVVEMLSSITGHSIKVEHVQKFMRDNEIPEVLGDYSLINKDLGWKPEIQLEDTLSIMVKE